MKNLYLDTFDVQGMSTNEMKQTDGGGWKKTLFKIFLACSIETHNRGTLRGMNQVNVHLWG